MSYGLALDLLLAVLLAATIGFSAVLNRRLAALRGAKQEMQAMIGEFVTATNKAESGLAALRQRAESAAGELERRVGESSKRVEDTRALADELAFLVEKGGGLADRLDQAIAAARSAGPEERGRRAPGKDAAKTDESAAQATLLKTLDAMR